MQFDLEINGEKHSVDVDPQTPLLWVLRDELGLNGTKYSCGVAQCGACTAHLDEVPVRSCVTPIKAVGGRKVTTIEGIEGPVAEAVQAAWEGLQVPQCGYCQSGQIMTTVALLREVPEPSDHDIDNALEGNLCRCATYLRIRGAVHEAAAKLGERS
ncbi:MAG: (2Fe-2S)-binding protein [Acidobacteriota bacterium]